MKAEELGRRLSAASQEVTAHEEILTEIDSKFGDGDHGMTMKMIADAIIDAVKRSHGSVKDMMEQVAEAVGELGGGSVVPLWNSWLKGMAEAAADGEEADLNNLKAMFANGFDEIDFMSGARTGSKTIMDALKPATKAAMEAEEEEALFIHAAKAAMEGAESTKNYTAKFGQASSYGEKTIGTPDAGALSMAYFLAGLAKKP